jgi:hypothetical protein
MIVAKGLLIVIATVAAACLVIGLISVDRRSFAASGLASLAVIGVGRRAAGMACPQSVRYTPLMFGHG